MARRLSVAFLPPVTLGILLILIPWAGNTGEYHVGGTLVCFDCHTMHYSQQHEYTSGDPPAISPAPGGPFEFLLRGDGINNLCLSCHDGQDFSPDVLGDHANGYVRQAGALNRVGGAAPYEDWKGHTLDLTARPPGGVSNIQMTCQQCHEVHGSSYYRNLSGPVTYTKAQPYASRTLTVDVWLAQWVQGDLDGNYSYDSVRFNEPNPNNGAYPDFCQGCHTRFHGSVGSSEIGGSVTTGGFLRHPNAQVNIGALGDGHSSIDQYNAGQNRVHVMSNVTADYLANPGLATFTSGDGLTPSCFSCHKAHGNQNPFGLIFLARGPGAVTEEGTSGVTTAVGLRNLCGQCHVQGN